MWYNRSVLRIGAIAAAFAVIHSCCEKSSGQDCLHWTVVNNGTPSARLDATMVYDKAIHEAVLFGGHDNHYALNGTYLWNGTYWTLLSGYSPSERSEHSMAYDSLRQRVVMCGGINSYGYFDHNTYEWNGQYWSTVSQSGAAFRRQAAMAYDPIRGVSVLFGGISGESGDVLGDTWTWNGSVWVKVSSGGPSPRVHTAMTFDVDHGVVVLFGGLDANYNRLQDTWTWNGSVWTQAADSGPSPRFEHSMTYDENRHIVMLYGGVGGNGANEADLGDTWTWDGTAWQLVSENGPGPRIETAMTYDSDRGEAVLFGGAVGDYPFTLYSDTWFYNCSGFAMQSVTGSCPGEITATMVGAVPGGRVVVIGSPSSMHGCHVPFDLVCAGLYLPLDPAGIQWVGTVTADSNGVAALTRTANTGHCGASLSAIDIGTCTASNVMQIP